MSRPSRRSGSSSLNGSHEHDETETVTIARSGSSSNSVEGMEKKKCKCGHVIYVTKPMTRSGKKVLRKHVVDVHKVDAEEYIGEEWYE